MYYDYSKYLREILNAQSRQMSLISSIPQKNLESLLKSANISTQILSTYNKSLLNPGYFNVINNINIQDALNIELPSIFKDRNFQQNLFSEKVLNNFMEFSNFAPNDITRMNDILRNSFIDAVKFSSFIEAVEPADPIEDEKTDDENKDFPNTMLQNYLPPSKSLFNNVSMTFIGGVPFNIYWHSSNNEPVNIPISVFVLMVSLICYYFTIDSNDSK